MSTGPPFTPLLKPNNPRIILDFSPCSLHHVQPMKTYSPNTKIHIESYVLISNVTIPPKPSCSFTFLGRSCCFHSCSSIAYSLKSSLRDVFETGARSCCLMPTFPQCPPITLQWKNRILAVAPDCVCNWKKVLLLLPSCLELTAAILALWLLLECLPLEYALLSFSPCQFLFPRLASFCFVALITWHYIS